MPRAGEYRHKLRVLNPKSGTETPTTLGDVNIEYDLDSDPVYIWASVEQLTGRELLFAQQIRADITHKIRYRKQKTTNITHMTRLERPGMMFQCGPPISTEGTLRDIENQVYAYLIV